MKDHLDRLGFEIAFVEHGLILRQSARLLRSFKDL